MQRVKGMKVRDGRREGGTERGLRYEMKHSGLKTKIWRRLRVTKGA